MANAVRVRVELKHYKDEREDFKIMCGKFNKAAAEIKREYKERATYESKSRKRRKRRRISEAAILRNKLRENFAR